MQAGKLRRVISIQSQVETPDSFGQPQQTWSDVLSTRASINAITSKEMYQAQAYTSQISHKVTIRYPRSTPIRNNMRVLYGDRTFIIQGVSDPDENKVQLNLYCLELNP